MIPNRVVLAVDWSNLCFRSLFINQLYGGSQSSSFNNMSDCKSFIYKFATDVCSIINIFKPTNVILLADSQHAWRKDVLPGDNGYKSNRQRSATINWDNIFKCSNDLKRIFQKAGCHIAEVEHSEADDMAALAKELVFDKYPDHNLIIVSADADIRQLIDFNKETGQYCAVYNTTTKGKSGKRYFYVTEDFMNWFNQHDAVDIFFNNVDMRKQYIKDILAQNNKIEICVENPNEILLNKIFCGDDGDCVPSFYEWIHNGKFTRITPAKGKKICETLNIKESGDLTNIEAGLNQVLETICKKPIDDIDISERLLRQRTLVELKSTLFPQHIQDYKDTIDYMLQSPVDHPIVNIKAADLLKGTDYEGADKKQALASDIFKDMEKYGMNLPKLF